MARRAQPGRNLARHKKGAPWWRSGPGPTASSGRQCPGTTGRCPGYENPNSPHVAGDEKDRRRELRSEALPRSISPRTVRCASRPRTASHSPEESPPTRGGGPRDRRGGRGAVTGVRTGPHGVSTPASFGCKYRMIHGARAGRLAPDQRRAAGPGGVAGRHGPEEEARRPRGGTTGSAGTGYRSLSFPTARADAVPDGSFEGPYGIFADRLGRQARV